MSMTEAEIREALARAERATGGECIVRNRYSHGGGRMYREDGPARDLILDVYDKANREFYFSARTDVPRLAADLLAARAERDDYRTKWCKAVGVANQIAARCRELEAERAIVADYLRDTDADFRARRPSERAVLDALLSPPPPHTCQIHRATSGASDCGLSPCEEAKVHRDRGASRPATVRRVRPAPSQEARCGSRTKLRGSDGRPLCERHGGVRADFQQNDEPCMRVKATPVEDMPRAQVQAELAARGIDVAPAVATVMDALGRTSECACPDPRCAQHGSAPAPCSSCVGDAPAETATHEAAKCATCGHEERRHLSEDGDGARWCDVALCDCVDYAADEKCKTCGGEGGVSRIEAVGHDEYGDLVGEAVSEPCPDCHGCGGAK